LDLTAGGGAAPSFPGPVAQAARNKVITANVSVVRKYGIAGSTG
jgi:hypothetical protein